MTIDTRIKHELFAHVISKLVLATYTVSHLHHLQCLIR